MIAKSLKIHFIFPDNIKQIVTKTSTNLLFHIIFVPRRCVLCERKLQELGVYGDFQVHEFSPGFYAFDSDLISLEWPLAWVESKVEQDMSSLYHAAQCLMTVQCLYGVIPYVQGLGKAAKHVYDIMVRMRREIQGVEPNIMPQIDNLILVDRSIDLLSPMVMQLNYEGLLDEIYGIQSTVIKLPGEKFKNNSATEEGSSSSSSQATTSSQPAGILPPAVPTVEMKRFHLNSGEELYRKLRDAHYLSIGPILKASAKSLADQFDERKLAKTVREIRQFVDKIPFLQKIRESQANQTSMIELIRAHTDREEFHEYLFVSSQGAFSRFFSNGLSLLHFTVRERTDQFH